MTVTGRLGRRVTAVEKRSAQAQANLWIDVDRLTGAQADRLRVLVSRSLAGITTDAEASELKCLLHATLTFSQRTKPRNRFFVPKSLERYWRMQKYADTGYELPGFNYRFNELAYADRERLLHLCRVYGWELQKPDVSIAPLKAWLESDLDDLADILMLATPDIERDLRHFPGGSNC